MKDISEKLKRAFVLLDGYNSKLISCEIEELSNIWCRLEDDSNLKWYLISKTNGRSVEEHYGYLSVKFPIAFLMKDCPKSIYNILLQKKVLSEDYCERYSCKEDILKKYVEDKVIIDDRFLYDERIPFDEELF